MMGIFKFIAACWLITHVCAAQGLSREDILNMSEEEMQKHYSPIVNPRLYDPYLDEFNLFSEHGYLTFHGGIFGKIMECESRIAFESSSSQPGQEKYLVLSHLFPDVALDELKDLEAISQSSEDEDEIRGWQKLVRYYNDFYQAYSIPAEIVDERITEEAFQHVYQMMWVRLRFFEKAVDSLFATRTKKGYSLDRLERLKKEACEVLKCTSPDGKRYSTPFGITSYLPFARFNKEVSCDLQDIYNMLGYHQLGRKMNLEQATAEDIKPDGPL